MTGNHWSTTITDPGANQTYFDFLKDSATTNPTNNFYETQRVVRQGSSTTLMTFVNCYNNNVTNCASSDVASPISKKDAYIFLNSGSSNLSETTYDSFGLPTDHKDFDWGQTLVRETVITYNRSLTNNIVDRPSSVVVKDSASVTKAQTTYSYDETSVTSTSGTPQHIAVSGSRGNLTTLATQANGTTTLYRKFAYYDTGTRNTATDLSISSSTNGPTTTYNYAAGSCGNSFATSISEPLSLSRSMTWNCTGGVLLSLTDENGKVTSTSYTDSFFWRPASVTDQLSNVASITYPNVTRTESTMTFNGGSSVVDRLIQLDGFGRTIVSQTRQGPNSSNYDSVETDYDTVGRVSKVTLPYSGAAGALCSGTCPGTSFAYDPLNRVTSATDGGTGSVSNGYTNNYVDQTLGPAPTGENTKRKEMVFDGLGRLTSICEITAGTGAGPCQAGSSPTGYWTKYTYDVLNNLTAVAQNAQGTSQQRTYAYDRLGRLTSEINPETSGAAITYFYDALSGDAACGTVTSAGDLVKRVDAAGKSACYGPYSLHRVSSIVYPSSSTPSKYFVYEAATVNGAAMSNAKTRLAEAYTCTSCPGTKITDLGFSYSARGEVTDTWQSSPNSAGYYHLTASYWPHGAVKSISGLAAMPTIYYGASDGTGLDGEGRITKVTASSGQNPVTGVTYSTSTVPVGFLSTVTYGSGDSDSFTPDTNTGRLTQYQFKMGTSNLTDTGALTWNANGSLHTLAITDQINSLNTQTCNYTYDDLARVKTANCGSAWNQTFSFDPFGNVDKTATVGTSFTPTYNLTTNRIQSLTGCTISYDANGNPLQDCARGSQDTYTWDGEGKPATIDGVSFVFDALGRGVEVNSGSNHVPIVYSPTGEKLAQFTGASMYRGYVPLPGGGKAVYLSSGLGFYYHRDCLGSGRLATTPSRTLYQDLAYAPYGEDYAKTGATWDLSFTGQTQDELSAMYDFLYRNYSPITGRWFSPDPAGLAAVSPADPQTWNRYAYVRNNPLAYIDPTGLACYPLEKRMFGSCAPFMGNVRFGSNWNEFDLFWGWTECENGDCGRFTIRNGLAVALALGGAANNGKSICSGAAGKTIPVNSPSGQMRFQFDGAGNLSGFGLQLTGMNAYSASGLSIPANTFAGFTQLSPGTVQFGFSNPVNVGSGFSQAYFQTATFSGGRFTSVQGAYAPLGIPLGSSSGNSSILQSFLNGNSSTASQAQNFGNLINSFASLVSSNVSCQAVFGGG